MKLSAHFSRSEFKCNCGKCDYDTADAELIEVLEQVRKHFNQPVKITSGNRCETYNREVGGSTNSYHVRGRAADIQVHNVPPSVIQEFLLSEYPDKYGIGCYSSFTHIDTRSGKGRW